MEANDMKAMRETLEEVAQLAAEIMERVRHKDGLAFNTANYIVGIVRATLAKPPRNCDMGTAGEQYNRFGEFCMRHYKEGNVMKCGQCPFSEPTCKFAWAQMPYEESDTNK